jgi:hypothetical protein
VVGDKKVRPAVQPLDFNLKQSVTSMKTTSCLSFQESLKYTIISLNHYYWWRVLPVLYICYSPNKECLFPGGAITQDGLSTPKQYSILLLVMNTINRFLPRRFSLILNSSGFALFAMVNVNKRFKICANLCSTWI